MAISHADPDSAASTQTGTVLLKDLQKSIFGVMSLVKRVWLSAV
jgi:hypothetical protein